MKPQSELLDAPAHTRQSHDVTGKPSSNDASTAVVQKRHGAKLVWIFIFAVFAAGLAFVLGFFPRAKDRDAVKRDTRELAEPVVHFKLPEPSKPQQTLLLSGEVRPLTEAAIYARVNGYVKRWLADIGARVEQGQLLAEIETPEAEGDLAQARAELAQAEAARALAGKTAERWREMLATKTTSQQEADEKSADFDLKKATVEAAKAKVLRLEEMLRFNKITAPFAGTVTARTVDVGQLVTAGAGRELFHIVQSEKLRVFVRVPQNYARGVQAVSTAELTFPDMPGRIFEAKVVRTAGAIEAASRTLLTELEADNTGGELFAGSYAQVRFRDVKHEAALTIPASSLIFRSEGSMVALVNEQERVELRKVSLGRDFGMSVEVLAGITTRERVIVNPPDSLVEDTKVNAVKEGVER